MGSRKGTPAGYGVSGVFASQQRGPDAVLTAGNMFPDAVVFVGGDGIEPPTPRV